ncbi:thiol-disulfide oxidoreductase DCC family protein [Mesorhizobium caraganae]|uniref:thiol-disulfide oxidoreductase DCC family protein n=1 Tax=Mesorhizobium caraganae TaxID=483206 RepID=UPI0033393E76
MTSPPEPFDASQPLIVFDGVCVLCSGFVRTVVRLDRKNRFRFATAQSPLGEALFHKHGLRTDSYETNLVLIGGAPFMRLDSFVAVMAELGWPWRAAKALLLLPRPLRDWLYERIAKNRYAIFGRKDSCEIPSATMRARMIG